MPRDSRDILDEHIHVKNLIIRLQSEFELDESDELHLKILKERKLMLKTELNSRYGEIKCCTLD